MEVCRSCVFGPESVLFRKSVVKWKNSTTKNKIKGVLTWNLWTRKTEREK